MSEINDRKLGALVTNKWLVGVLVALCMSMGGYIFNGIDRTSDATAQTLDRFREDITALQIAQGRNEAHYAEIMRRFDRVDSTLQRLESRRRVEAP